MRDVRNGKGRASRGMVRRPLPPFPFGRMVLGCLVVIVGFGLASYVEWPWGLPVVILVAAVSLIVVVGRPS